MFIYSIFDRVVELREHKLVTWKKSGETTLLYTTKLAKDLYWP